MLCSWLAKWYNAYYKLEVSTWHQRRWVSACDMFNQLTSCYVLSACDMFYITLLTNWPHVAQLVRKVIWNISQADSEHMTPARVSVSLWYIASCCVLSACDMFYIPLLSNWPHVEHCQLVMRFISQVDIEHRTPAQASVCLWYVLPTVLCYVLSACDMFYFTSLTNWPYVAQHEVSWSAK